MDNIMDMREKLSITGKRILSNVRTVFSRDEAIDRSGLSENRVCNGIERLARKKYIEKIHVDDIGYIYRKMDACEFGIHAIDLRVRNTFKNVCAFIMRKKVYNVNSCLFCSFDGGALILVRDDSFTSETTIIDVIDCIELDHNGGDVYEF